MPFVNLVCARCTAENHPASRFCSSCGLPLGSAEPDVDAALEALGPYESPEPADPDVRHAIREFVEAAGFEATPAGHGWRLVVSLRKDRRQAVYVGSIGTDPDGRGIVSLVSVCGPATARDAGSLLKLNAMAVEAHFAIKVLRGEEYFIVAGNLTVAALAGTDPASLVRRVAAAADGLEERLTRGRDLF